MGAYKLRKHFDQRIADLDLATRGKIILMKNIVYMNTYLQLLQILTFTSRGDFLASLRISCNRKKICVWDQSRLSILKIFVGLISYYDEHMRSNLVYCIKYNSLF